ncbi:MAG: Asp-tRNA(Asn)/Glu-tRNA(Gln) amidotransferase subunit GatC [Proteobacteria bacterium]|nr:Asp-tRNA(Asn)/Glu-tRNA(Gln) amidotransferase subunit GatC [Pseudomonadota bacterium]
MTVGKDDVRKIAKLARLALDESRVEPMVGELNGIFQWVEQLNEVNVEGVPPLTSVVEQRLKMRDDVVTEGDAANALMANAPSGEDHFFVVPKVVE